MYSKSQQKQSFELSKQLLQDPTATDLLSASVQLKNLVEVIQFHEWKYYVQNDPLLSDYEYDQLYKKLEALETAFPNLIQADSPTQRVSPGLTDDFPPVPHLTPMLSLDNSYNAEDLKDFDERIRKLTGLEPETPIEYVVEPKFDGGTIALVYENDQLVRGATRGNGTLGEDITSNSKVIRSIPLKANFGQHGIQKVELRGEVLIRKENFDKINKKRETAGQSIFANPRNAATGGLRMKDPKEVAQRGLEAFIYQLGYAEDETGASLLQAFPTHAAGIETLKNLGFKVPTHELKICKDIEQVADFCQYWQDKREDYPYEIDGMVVKVNALELQELCGYTSHHPRWAIAFKFKAKQASTKLLHVEYQVGKVGSITPVAKLEPVQLAGVRVASVSLHNEDFITGKDLHLGDTVLVERAGDVIPYIVKAMEDLRDGSETKIQFPTHCPINDTETPIALIRSEGEAAWRCPDCVCGKQHLQRIIFHVSKTAMDIDGMGKSIIERFHEMGWLKTIADVYRLDYEQVAQLEGFGQRSALNLEKSIHKAKQNPISRLLHSLSVHHLGKKAAKLIAAEIEHVLDLRTWDEERFLSIKEIGPVLARNVIEFFSHEKNIALLEEMEKLGVNLHQTETDKKKAVITEGALVGKTILFTGTLVQMGRKEAQQLAEAQGAKLLGSVSKNLNILVAGEKAGSKLKKAQAIETVEVWTEEEFIQITQKPN